MEKYFLENEPSGNTLYQTLVQRCKGLIYSSETDAPVEAFTAPADGRSVKDVVLDLCSLDDEPDKIEEQRSSNFFDSAARKAEWHDESRAKRAETFQELQKLLENGLRSVGVYKIGKTDRQIFVAGLDDNGNVVGIRTRSVET
jgi:hypothetical protein